MSDSGPSMSLADFVIQEAKEKTFEIDIKTLKQFEKEKAVIVEKELVGIQEEFQKKLRKVEMEIKIDSSARINHTRLVKMEARNKCMRKIFGEAQYKIYEKIHTDRVYYRSLLEKLLAQGLIKLWEKQVVIRCLERDLKDIELIVGPAKKQFKEIVKREMGFDFEVEIEVQKNRFLQPREVRDHGKEMVKDYDHVELETIEKNEEDKKCFGGFLLMDKSGLIILKNTLDVRVDLTFQDSLPDIRRMLFPSKQKN